MDEQLIANVERLNSPERYSDGVVILLKLLDNVIREPQNTKYRAIRLENKVIKEKLLCLNGIRELLASIGFEEIEGELRLPSNLIIAKLKKFRDVLKERLECLQQKLKSHITQPRNDDQALPSSSTKNTSIQRPTVSHAKKFIEFIPRRPYHERTTFSRVIPFNNPFLQQMETTSDMVMQYEDEQLLLCGRKVIPIERLTEGATKKLRSIQKEILSKRTSSNPELCLSDLILCELARWFNEEFFTWVNSLPCKKCGNENVSTKGSYVDNGVRVETFTCCNDTSKFYRFNDVALLLKSRRGRCGEYANCFTFLCRCLGYDARLCYATFDHVWTEVYSVYQKRWLHIDPSDNVVDAPLMYQHGWKRDIDYVIGFSRDDVQDVTWRYANNHKELQSKRTKCSESDLLQTITLLRNKRRVKLTPVRCTYLNKRSMIELVELMTPKQVTENERKGRSSGSLNWKLSRGEQNVNNFYIFSATPSDIKEKQFNLRYSCSRDTYERYAVVDGQPIIRSEVKNWESCHYLSSNIFRKEERDWKMVYLARAEDADTATIAWKFDFAEQQLVIHSVAIKFETKTYENGAIDLQILNEHGNAIQTMSELTGATAFSINVTMRGGKGETAWQHTQLFRQRIGSNDYPFEINVTFK